MTVCGSLLQFMTVSFSALHSMAVYCSVWSAFYEPDTFCSFWVSFCLETMFKLGMILGVCHDHFCIQICIFRWWLLTVLACGNSPPHLFDGNLQHLTLLGPEVTLSVLVLVLDHRCLASIDHRSCTIDLSAEILLTALSLSRLRLNQMNEDVNCHGDHGKRKRQNE